MLLLSKLECKQPEWKYRNKFVLFMQPSRASAHGPKDFWKLYTITNKQRATSNINTDMFLIQ